MAAETAIIQGLAVVFFGLVWISFKLNDSEESLSNWLGVLFLSLGIAVMQMIGWTVLEMAAANSLTYVVNGVTIGLIWVLNIALFLFWSTLFIRSLIYMSIAATRLAGKIFGKQVGK